MEEIVQVMHEHIGHKLVKHERVTFPVVQTQDVIQVYVRRLLQHKSSKPQDDVDDQQMQCDWRNWCKMWVIIYPHEVLLFTAQN